MKEQRCPHLECTDGEPADTKSIPAIPPVHARAECGADLETECPKTRAKFRITELCFRVVRKQKKDRE